ncbi:MAG: replicative DNA helicase [Candidatus Aminicenantia bacterium]
MAELLSLSPKSLPHNAEAERTVIGAIIIENSNLHKVLSVITQHDFYIDAHQKIMKKIVEMAEDGQLIDLLTLSEELEKAGELKNVGGTSYLSSLLDGVPKNLNIESYLNIIKEKSLARRLILASMRIMKSGIEGGDPDELLDLAQHEIFEVSEQRVKQGFLEIKKIMQETVDYIEALSRRGELISGIPTDFKGFDKKTSGLHNGEFIVIAGRPSMGKTAFAMNIATNAAIKFGKKVGIFTLEMSKEHLCIRLLGSKAKVDIQRLQNGYLTQEEWNEIILAQNAFSRADVFIDDTPSLSILEMKAKARRLKLERGLDILFIDYLQLMRGGARFENRNQEISAISRSMKELAKELSIPVVAISQLSRAPEKRERKGARPQLSDLRESGAIEQDADLVAFVYREEYYNKDTPKKGIAEIIIAKQRNGPPGDVELAFLSKYTRFEDLVQTEVD